MNPDNILSDLSDCLHILCDPSSDRSDRLIALEKAFRRLYQLRDFLFDQSKLLKSSNSNH